MTTSVATWNITLGATLKPFNVIVYDENDVPDDLSAYDAVRFVIRNSAGSDLLAETATGLTVHPTKTVTLDSTNNWVYCPSHGFKRNNIAIFATSGSLSGTGLTASYRYKVTETDDDWFRVSLRSDGPPVTIAGAGTGTHTAYLLGSLTIDLASAEVDTALSCYLVIVLVDGSEKHPIPDGGRYITVTVSNWPTTG